MRAGKVARIRVSPRDCMSVVDVCKVLGLDPRGMSWGQAVSTAFSALLAAGRKQGLIPERDGFEYNEMMAPYGGSPQERRAGMALGAGATLDRVPTMGIRQLQAGNMISPGERQRLDIRWNELALRRQLTPENFTPEDQVELNDLCAKFGYKMN